MLENNTIKIGLIPCAVGGTSIDLWFPGQYDRITKTYPYDAAIQRTKIAMQYGVLKGILWHQGESDNTPQRAAHYLEKQITVIRNFRRDLGIDVPFVLGELGHFKEVQLINKIIKDIPVLVPDTGLVTTEGLEDRGDKTHFDTRSARELGKRYAEILKKITLK